jgi:arginyl-tRNA synthetase
MMNGPDGKPFRSRTGGNIKMIDLLNEAEERAYTLVKTKNANVDEHELRTIASAVGVSSVKYADLSKHRTSDYVFSWDSMLAFEGNTAPYMLYAYTRVAGIFRKTPSGNLENFLREHLQSASIQVQEPQERVLAMALTQFPEVVQNALTEYLPHYLCTYLYELAGAFMSFYEACPVLTASEDERQSRLLLAALTAKTLQRGLGLLGISTLEKM